MRGSGGRGEKGGTHLPADIHGQRSRGSPAPASASCEQAPAVRH